MAVDLRQVVAGILTVTMFVMLGHMIKRDHFDSVGDAFIDDVTDSEFNGGRLSDAALSSFGKNTKGPWIDDTADLKPCWDSSSLDDVEESSGFVSFSLTSGPEYHVSQVANAVVVARYLGAELIIPDIRGNVAGDTRKFEEIYDVDAFMKGLNGVVKVREELPSSAETVVVKIPNRVTEDFISESVEPQYRQQKSIRLTTYFPTMNMRKFGSAARTNSDKVACLGMFGSLKPVSEIGEAVEYMMGRMRHMGRSAEGRFVAVDLRVEMLDGKGCNDGVGATKSCFSAQEIAVFLRKVGFNKDTVVYVTQSKWVDELDVLKDIFPRTFTKGSVMEASKRTKYMDSELERIIDFYVCSQSDVFVPATSGLFYANVVGQRIANGKTEVLVPSSIQGTSAPVDSHLSPYISKKNHLAYSCYC